MPRPTGKPTDTEPLEEREYQALLPHLADHWRMFYEMLWQTGIRVNEGLSRLKTDLDDGGVWIDREKRTAHPLRDWLPLTPELFQQIYEYCHRAHRERIFPFTSAGAWKALKAACVAAGIRTTIHPHSFRHGLGHRARQAGIDMQVRQRMMGHSNIQSTQVYSKGTKAEMVEAFKKLNEKTNT